MMRNNNITIVVNTCDAYADVLKLFFAAFDEYWPNRNYKIVINSEQKIYAEYAAETHISVLDNCHWGERLLNTLESIDTEFVLMLYDDFILEDNFKLNDLISAEQLLLSNNEISVVYLVNTNLPIKYLELNKIFLEVQDQCGYRLNSAPGLWRREHLISYTGKEDNPWAWEVFGSYRTFRQKKKFYTLNSNFPDVFPYNYKKGGAIYRGKWVRDVIDEKISKYKLDINLMDRGYSDQVFEPRSLVWKLNFFFTGYKMIGIEVFKVIIDLFKLKYFAKRSN